MHPKRIKATVPGQLTSFKVIDNDLSSAVRLWKRMLKENKTLEECYLRQHFEKPSRARRKQLNNAKYLEEKNASKSK